MNDNSTEQKILKDKRLCNCEICNLNQSKYTCPKCYLKTCSLECCKKHKEMYNCTGEKDPVVYIDLADMNYDVLMSDYNYLRDVERRTDSVKRKFNDNSSSKRSKTDISKNKNLLIKQLKKYDITYEFLPEVFSRSKQNRSYYNKKEDIIYLSIEWNINSINLFTHKINDTMIFKDIYNQLIENNHVLYYYNRN